MRIAVVGSGISGLVCAYLLAEKHDVILFEKEGRLGGHTCTVPVEHEGRSLAVDTGFIVFNEKNYPGFCRLLARLGVESRPTTMSFSVRDESDGFEYGGSSVAGILGSPANLGRRRWWSVVHGVARLHASGRAALAGLPPDATVADLCSSGRFSAGFLDSYLLPMAAAIWSCPREDLMRFPARFLLRFFDNHGMLDLRRRPQWRTVVGGSRRYIDAMMVVLKDRVRVGLGVEALTRYSDGVEVRAVAGKERFDRVILATHADQSLALLTDASEAERTILSAMPYQLNDVVLHTDARLLPRSRRCWSAWNYLIDRDAGRPPVVTYNMAILQGFSVDIPLCVTLNATDQINPSAIIRRCSFSHPLYTIQGESARANWAEISGANRTHYCGAYWGNGFHEDGVASAVRVCEQLGARL